jgi:hypothetical protein
MTEAKLLWLLAHGLFPFNLLLLGSFYGSPSLYICVYCRWLLIHHEEGEMCSGGFAVDPRQSQVHRKCEQAFGAGTAPENAEPSSHRLVCDVPTL